MGIDTESGRLTIIGTEPRVLSPSQVIKFENSDVLINCDITGIPEPTRTWFKVRYIYNDV